MVVDVVADTSDTPLPAEAGERAFALARRMDLVTGEPTELVAVEDGDVVAKATAPIATTSSLIALKTVAIARRARGDSPQKVGSDIHDLVRLVHSCDFDAVVDSLATAGDDLRIWVAAMLVKSFSPEQDLRYAFARLRRLARSTDAEILSEDDLAIVAELGHQLLSQHPSRSSRTRTLSGVAERLTTVTGLLGLTAGLTPPAPRQLPGASAARCADPPRPGSADPFGRLPAVAPGARSPTAPNGRGPAG